MNRAKKIFTNITSKIAIFGATAGYLLFAMPRPTYAVRYNFLPDYINNIIEAIAPETGGTQDYVNNRVKAGLTILFIVVFIVAIAYSALAAIKFISSQGDASKLEESKAAVKAILMGFAAMLIAIIGLFVILYLLGSGEATPPAEIPITPP